MKRCNLLLVLSFLLGSLCEFDCFRYQKHSLDVNAIYVSTDTTLFAASSVVTCSLIAQRIFEWTTSGVFCFGSSECIASNLSLRKVENLLQDQHGWNCYSVEPEKSEVYEIAATLGLEIKRKQDGMFYFFGNVALGYEDSLSFCLRVPGFGLPKIITQTQFDVCKDILVQEGSFMLGLNNDEDSGEVIWNNGIPFSVTSTNTNLNIKLNDGLSEYQFHLWNTINSDDYFHDVSSTSPQQVVCQANLDNLDWFV